MGKSDFNQRLNDGWLQVFVILFIYLTCLSASPINYTLDIFSPNSKTSEVSDDHSKPVVFMSARVNKQISSARQRAFKTGSLQSDQTPFNVGIQALPPNLLISKVEDAIATSLRLVDKHIPLYLRYRVLLI